MSQLWNQFANCKFDPRPCTPALLLQSWQRFALLRPQQHCLALCSLYNQTSLTTPTHTTISIQSYLCFSLFNPPLRINSKRFQTSLSRVVRQILYSSGVKDPFWLLQNLQQYTMFAGSEVPPRLRGIKCSTVALLNGYSSRQ